MRVLVAGGAGFIGSAVTRVLLEEGHDVTVLDNLSKGFRELIAEGARFIDGDLENVLLHKVYADAGAAPASLHRDFIVDWRDGFWVATNFTSASEPIPASAAAKVLVGAREVPPGGVTVWME